MDKKNFTIIGNCQSSTLSQFLLSNICFSNTYNYIKIQNIHEINEEQLDLLYSTVLLSLDLIIIQPISENYRNNYKYSTKSILDNVNKNCIKIIFPSLYFDFYHPFLIYLNDINNNKIGNPFDYHDWNITQIYVKGKEFIDNNVINKDDMKKYIIYEYNNKLYDMNILDENFMNDKLYKNLNNLIERENSYSNYCNDSNNLYTIKSSEFIINNYKKNLLFYSINHPSKYLFHYISNNILVYLNIPLMQYNDDLDPLKGLIMPVYGVIQKFVDFNIDYYQNFRHYDLILTDEDILEKYIYTYNNLDINIFKNIQ
jgi:hypothetical protein